MASRDRLVEACESLFQFIRDGFDVHGHCEICNKHEDHEDYCPWPAIREQLNAIRNEQLAAEQHAQAAP